MPPLISVNLKSSPFNTNGSQSQTQWEDGRVSQVSVGVAALSNTHACTNLRSLTYTHTLFGLVVFKPDEISCKSVKSLPAFTLACKKRHHSACPCWLLGIKACYFSHFQLHPHCFFPQIVLIHLLSLATGFNPPRFLFETCILVLSERMFVHVQYVSTDMV